MDKIFTLAYVNNTAIWIKDIIIDWPNSYIGGFPMENESQISLLITYSLTIFIL